MMSYTAHERNGDMSMQDQTSAAIRNAMENLNSKKRKRDMTELDAGGSQSGPKRGSTSHMNGASHDGNAYLDSLHHHSSNSNDFSSLSQQLQAATHSNHGLPPTNASSTAAAALAGIMPQMTIPQPTHLSFASEASNTEADRQFDSSFDMGGDGGHGHNGQGPPYNHNSFPGTTAAQVQAARESSNGGSHKPSVGSDEWHKVRRDNHKEVERRRRETINEGINELAKIVPGCEKNKGSILQRAVEYINQLKSNEEKNIERYTKESEVSQGLCTELTATVNSLKHEVDRSTREAAMWKKIAVDAGLQGQLGDGRNDGDAEGEGVP
ncbi:MAG: hypothetical protein LQ348_007786 [Seirophora lacunosa]|nr:MAG: hypothetical protein LQ348_007786 [Seirophora lacunosa]